MISCIRVLRLLVFTFMLHCIESLLVFRKFLSEIFPKINIIIKDNNDDLKQNIPTSYIDTETTCYNGPKTNANLMESTIPHKHLDINVMVGPSTISPQAGKGLFIQANSLEKNVKIKQGEYICGYPLGRFVHTPIGDKSIAFVFTSLSIPVLINNKFMTLYDAINLVVEMINNSNGNRDSSLENVLWGHRLVFEPNYISKDTDSGSGSGGDIYIAPEDDANLYYQPYENVDFNDDQIGVYANDLAYVPNMSEDLYRQTHRNKNILQIVWELQISSQQNDNSFNEKLKKNVGAANYDVNQQYGDEYNSHKSNSLNWMLKPIRPVIVTSRDVIITGNLSQDLDNLNSPALMEVGISYSWLFWILNSTNLTASE